VTQPLALVETEEAELEAHITQTAQTALQTLVVVVVVVLTTQHLAETAAQELSLFATLARKKALAAQ
jgi:hypothetical protein